MEERDIYYYNLENKRDTKTVMRVAKEKTSQLCMFQCVKKTTAVISCHKLVILIKLQITKFRCIISLHIKNVKEKKNRYIERERDQRTEYHKASYRKTWQQCDKVVSQLFNFL